MRRWLGLVALLFIAIGSTGTAAGIKHLSDLDLGVAFCFMAVVGGTVKAWVTDSSKQPDMMAGIASELLAPAPLAPAAGAPVTTEGALNASPGS